MRPDGNRMRLSDALINVGGCPGTSGHIRRLRKSGPHSVSAAEKRPIQAKTNERIAISSIQYIASAAKGDKFIAHPTSAMRS